MRVTPKDIARSLVDTLVASTSVDADTACESALALLRQRCPGVTPRSFVRLVERELRRRGTAGAGMLVVPREDSIAASALEPQLTSKIGKPVHLEREVHPELIGGAVLLVEHRRIDCSVQGALAELHRLCMLPLH